VIIGSNSDSLFSINSDNSLLWSFWTWDKILSSPVINSDGEVYISNNASVLMGFSSTGSLKFNWSYYDPSRDDSWYSPSIGVDDTICIGSHLGSSAPVWNFDSQGSMNWSFHTLNYVQSSPATAQDGNIYFGSWANRLYCLHSTGHFNWSYETGKSVFSSPAIGQDGRIYFGSWDNRLYSLRSNSYLNWSYETGSIVDSSPAVDADEAIYVGSWDNRTYCINSDGSLRWTYRSGCIQKSSPAIAQDGTIYIGTTDYPSGLHAIYSQFPALGIEPGELKA